MPKLIMHITKHMEFKKQQFQNVRGVSWKGKLYLH